MDPDVIDLLYFKLGLFDQTVVAFLFKFENLFRPVIFNLWRFIRSFKIKLNHFVLCTRKDLVCKVKKLKNLEVCFIILSPALLFERPPAEAEVELRLDERSELPAKHYPSPGPVSSPCVAVDHVCRNFVASRCFVSTRLILANLKYARLILMYGAQRWKPVFFEIKS